MIVLTTGYAGRDPYDLRVFAEHYNALVIDIRYSPWSNDSRWTLRSLQHRSVLGDRYWWFKELGNENYKDHKKPIKIHDLETGIIRLYDVEFDNPLILLCGCPHYAKCHRTIVSMNWPSTGRRKRQS